MIRSNETPRPLGIATACLIVVLAADPSAADPPGWKMVWSDDFDQLDEGRWTRVDTNIPTNNSRQDYLPEQVAVRDGKLVITATDSPSRGLPFRSGQVISKAEQRHGRWEVRAKLPTSRGMWPAIWLLPDVDRFPWPTGGEIDILENRGDEPHVTSSAFHYGTRDPYRHDFVYAAQQTAIGGGRANYHDSFHTYAVDWTPRHLRFYVDGVHHYSVYDEDVGGFLAQHTDPAQLVINNAIGGAFLDDPDGSTVWPQEMQVDWVRVYEPAPETFVARFEGGGFEQPSGVLSGWSVFGGTVSGEANVRIASEAVASGAASLKLFGMFSDAPSYSGVSRGVSVVGGAEVRAAASALVRSADSIAGTDNTVVLKVEFYNEFGAKYGGDRMLGEHTAVLASGESAEDAWLSEEVVAVAPPGAVEARVAIVFAQPGRSAGAVHIDDVSLWVASPAAAVGDFNADGVVNAADYSAWRDTLGATGVALPADGNGDGAVTGLDYRVWRANFRPANGRVHAPPLAAAPEPNAALAIGAAVAGCGASRLVLRELISYSRGT
ncbi:MAG: family 16 glycosylhydrolase [Planctomycetota bacterium]